ncbi:MAG: hypothetical protein WA672_11900 [Candidatus Angelobacter sp.]
MPLLGLPASGGSQQGDGGLGNRAANPPEQVASGNPDPIQIYDVALDQAEIYDAALDQAEIYDAALIQQKFTM